MKFVDEIGSWEKNILEIYKFESPNRRERIRAEAILLSGEKFKIEEISRIIKHERDSVSRWIDQFQEEGLSFISDGFRPGRPKKLNQEQEIIALSFIAESPMSLKAVIDRIAKELKVNISIKTLREIAKSLGLSWKRVRKSLKLRRDEKAFLKAKKEIEVLIELAKKKLLGNLF